MIEVDVDVEEIEVQIGCTLTNDKTLWKIVVTNFVTFSIPCAGMYGPCMPLGSTYLKMFSLYVLKYFLSTYKLFAI